MERAMMSSKMLNKFTTKHSSTASSLWWFHVYHKIGKERDLRQGKSPNQGDKKEQVVEEQGLHSAHINHMLVFTTVYVAFSKARWQITNGSTP